MRRRRIATLAVVLLALAMAVGWQWVQAGRQATLARGAALFHDGAGLSGRVTGHTLLLPANAARCANCHQTGTPAGSAAASAAGNPPPAAEALPGRLGPVLGRETLEQARPRRGGPASRYDGATFCALLRTGIDPAQVMIPQAMPRYDIANADCEALWRYLLEP